MCTGDVCNGQICFAISALAIYLNIFKYDCFEDVVYDEFITICKQFKKTSLMMFQRASAFTGKTGNLKLRDFLTGFGLRFSPHTRGSKVTHL